MGQHDIKTMLGQQMELLAEASKSKPDNLAELTVAMCEVADRLKESREPFSHLQET